MIERQPTGEYLVMLDDGSIKVAQSPRAALNHVKRDAERGNKNVTTTRVQWRNVPEGSVPPK